MQISKDLVAASSAPLVLSILVDGDSYGYELVKTVRELSGGQLQWTEGMLYPLLHRLEKQGWVTTYKADSPTGRARKYYSVTSEGKQALAEQRSQWAVVTGALRRAWEGIEETVAAPGVSALAFGGSTA